MKATASISGKALQTFLGGAIRAHRATYRQKLEWEIAFFTGEEKESNDNMVSRHVWDADEIRAKYARDDWRKAEQGASKTCHVQCHDGEDFQYIVIKRHQTNGYIDEHQYNPDYYHTGNQLIDEIRCWERFAKTPEADYLCPMLKWFTAKSDNVEPCSETMQEAVIIISQKAEKVGSCEKMCKLAAQMNGEPETWYERYHEMERFSKKQSWRDAMDNPGNSGMIYDYATKRYKAVFIDYAL